MSISLESASARTLIDELLQEQQRLTPVERFARLHADDATPAQARYYRELIPLSKPGPGEQYAFAVDLDRCTGCKACVSACHSLNGLEEDEIWRSVGVLFGGNTREPYQQTVTTACHHCVEPGCLLGCPVAAYDKNPETGIVRHLDDQCIGCAYCVLKCPYDVPKYSKARGIVRKCDMCHGRLAVGEAPACVQACPNEAITIRIVSQAQARVEALPGVRLLPGAFESSYTKPTTLYSTHKVVPANAHPGDIYQLRLEHPHWPLIAMLLLSQLSAGCFVCRAFTLLLPAVLASALAAPLVFIGFTVLQAGLLLSVFHLGQPMKAWRFFLGLRTSWMSREILAFGLFAGASAALTGAQLAGVARTAAVRSWIGSAGPWLDRLPLATVAAAAPVLSLATALLALAGLFCSAMIYIDTRRPFWYASLTFPKFFGTALALGLGTSTAVICGQNGGDAFPDLWSRGACLVSLAAGAAYAAWGFSAFHRQLRDDAAPAHRSARTIKTLLRPVLQAQEVGILFSLGAATLACLLENRARLWCAALALVFFFGAAICERYCFFTASDGPRMPGGIAT